MTEQPPAPDRPGVSKIRSSQGGTPIPIRVEPNPHAARKSLHGTKESLHWGSAGAQAYEEIDYGGGQTTTGKRKRAETLAQEVSRKLLYEVDWQPHSYPIDTLTDDERLWAALAHASFLLTALAGIVMSGWAALVLVFVPLVIYASYRDRSPFVAFHALQAFAAQVIGTIGWIALLTLGTLIFVIAIVLSAIASIVLIGIPFLLLFAVLYVVFVLAMLLLPLGVVILSIAGAASAYSGRDFRYPVLAPWIERLMGGELAF